MRDIRTRSGLRTRTASGFRCGRSDISETGYGDMTGSQPGFDRRVSGALDATPSRIPVVLGGCGSGRTWLLQRLQERAGRGAAQYIDVERCATTPERFLRGVPAPSRSPGHQGDHPPAPAREPFAPLLIFSPTARGGGGEA